HFGTVGYRQWRPQDSSHGYRSASAHQGFLGHFQFHDWRNRRRECGCLFHAGGHCYRCRWACRPWFRCRRATRCADFNTRVECQYPSAVRRGARCARRADAPTSFRYWLLKRSAMNHAAPRPAQLEWLLAGTLHLGTWLASAAIGLGLALALLDSRFSAPKLAILRDVRVATVGIALLI